MIFAAEPVSITELAYSGVGLAMVALATVLVSRISSRTKRTEEAVYTAAGVSVTEQMTRMDSRLAAAENRMTAQGTRLGALEESTSKAHRRVDDVEKRLATVTIEHGGRLTLAENAIHELQQEAP